jgi:hypothetical protein
MRVTDRVQAIWCPLRHSRERLVVSNDWLNPSIGRRCMLEAEQWRPPHTVSHSRHHSGRSVTHELAGSRRRGHAGETNEWLLPCRGALPVPHPKGAISLPCSKISPPRRAR